MIHFQAVSARYPHQSRLAVEEVTLSATRGALTAIVGPNGSGKSTLVRTVLGRITPVAGNVLVDDVPLGALDRRAVARRLAVVPQREEPLFPMRVRECIALGRYAHGALWQGTRREDQEIVRVAAERAGVTALLERRTDELSGGEWQRVRIARALAQGTSTIVLDEPTSFLDIAHEMAVFELLAALAHDGHAVLLVSHQLNLVARFADVIALLHHGRTVAVGSADVVMRGDLLESVYEWPVVVSRDPAIGAPALVPLRGRVPR